jgi:mono/diheme cytochrome c family protein
MTEVINYSTQFLNDADLNAMAAYLKTLPAKGDAGKPYVYDPATAAALRAGKFDKPGAAVYGQRCASCHGVDGKGYAPYLPPLAGNPAVLDPDPLSVVNIVLNGSARVVVAGMPNAYRMPRFRTLTDKQAADVINFVRSSWGNNAGGVETADVTRLRRDTSPAMDRVEVLSMK